MSLADAVAHAGECNGLGSLGKIVVLRPIPEGVRTVARVLRYALEEQGDGQGPELKPGDVVLAHP
jgi:hypothetical protein